MNCCSPGAMEPSTSAKKSNAPEPSVPRTGSFAFGLNSLNLTSACETSGSIQSLTEWDGDDDTHADCQACKGHDVDEEIHENHYPVCIFGIRTPGFSPARCEWD